MAKRELILDFSEYDLNNVVADAEMIRSFPKEPDGWQRFSAVHEARVSLPHSVARGDARDAAHVRSPFDPSTNQRRRS